MTKDREPTEAMVEAAWAEFNRSSRLYSHSLKTGHNLKTSFAAGYRAAMVTASPPVDHGRVEQWQLIETFDEPTSLSSGCGVLIADADGTVGEAYYRNFDDDDRGWWWANTSWGDYPEPQRPNNPTYWQPLPDPPALTNKDTAK